MLEANKVQLEKLKEAHRYQDAGTLLLVAAVGNALGNAAPSTVFLTALCYNCLAFATIDLDEEEMILKALDPRSDFFKHQVELIIMKLKLTENDNSTLSKSGLSIVDPRSLIADSILNFYSLFNLPHAKNDPRETLIPDLFEKIVSQGLGIVRMMNLGLFSEAFGSWRTLHESLCIVKLLISGGELVKESYLKHIVFSNAFRGGIEDEEERDHVFAVMKEEMKAHALKSKDMKKFIEYGWLYQYPTFKEDDPQYKLNFRDGIQRCADLRDYSDWYEAASELAHSSAIYFYSRSEYFEDLTIHGFYDMLKILSELFSSYYSAEFSALSSSKKQSYQSLEEELLKMVVNQEKYFTEKYFGGEDGNGQNL